MLHIGGDVMAVLTKASHGEEQEQWQPSERKGEIEEQLLSVAFVGEEEEEMEGEVVRGLSREEQVRSVFLLLVYVWLGM